MSSRRNPTASREPTRPVRPGEDTSVYREVVRLEDYPGYPQQVLWKLIIYFVAVAVIPISSYFYSVKYIYDGNTTYAGATAALVANGILFSYIILAMREDKGDRAALQKQAKEEKKTK